MDTDPGSIIIKIVTLFALIFVNAFFSMSEMAIVTLNDNKIDKMAEQGNKKAKQIKKLTENTSSFLSTIQIGVTLAGFLTSATAAQSFAEMLSDAIAKTPVVDVIPVGIISGFSTVVITLIMSYFSLVLGELVPKKIAMSKPEKMAFMAAPILVFVAKITRPIVKFLALSTNGVLRLMGIDPHADEEVVTEEEIRMMVDVGGEKGVIEDTQIEMINNIFEFDDIDVADIMTHRTDMVCVDEEEPLSEAVALSIENGFSRIPVFKEDPDNIIGIVYIKDFLKYVGTNLPKSKTVKDMMRPAYYVPETKRCGELFTEMTEKRVQMAVVVDEYGGTAGIVTLEDLLESIVGNIQDEYDQEDEEISIINDTTFEVDGITDIEEVEECTGKTFPEGDYDTIGGYIISVLGFLPQDGEMNQVQFENVKFTVLNVEERRIGKVKVEILPEEKKEEKEEERRFFSRKEE
ncbi:MAG: HlyC/CorC family transporter [Clostridia bacterium]|nr:HlyC/CorC family transporter [Clostridia bacterium]MBR2953201.1 HlyC/CorC family transporter [Clostridia bacterium]